LSTSLQMVALAFLGVLLRRLWTRSKTEPGLPVYLWGLSRFWHPQHHQFTGWTLCRLKAQVGRYYEM